MRHLSEFEENQLAIEFHVMNALIFFFHFISNHIKTSSMIPARVASITAFIAKRLIGAEISVVTLAILPISPDL